MSGQEDQVIAAGSEFRRVFIVESRDGWAAASDRYDPARDLVLTYDFALRNEIERCCGVVRYVDHLCSQAVMHENNFRMYRFFRDWHLDSAGSDLFRHRDVDFGLSFRIEIWNDFTFYVRARLCLEQLRCLRYQELLLDPRLELIGGILAEMGLAADLLPDAVSPGKPAYFFPIHRWMDERLRIRTWRQKVRDVVVPIQGLAMGWLDSLFDRFVPRRRVFVQEYHPTRSLMYALQADPKLRVLQGHFSARAGAGKFWSERPIPVYGSVDSRIPLADRLIEGFRQHRCARLVLSNGVDISEAAYRLIEGRVAGLLPTTLRNLDCVITYLDRHPVNLVIMIANLGQLAMLVDCAAKSRGVPTYMIINGWLGNDYLDDAKYATVINAYAESIRDNYFRGMDNVVCLGDPRMDTYAALPRRDINRASPTISIGASGFSNIDLNSFLAVEFEFLHEVLTAIGKVFQQRTQPRVILKVRPNGYARLYRDFVDEYFPGVVDRIEDQVPMRAVLDETDLFISIYSQTLFEASSLGIPCIYHKNDREIMDPPFDGKSELVTTRDIAGLEHAIADFLSCSDRFDAFLRPSVREKYIGPLDGRNLERNLTFVNELIENGYGRSGQ